MTIKIGSQCVRVSRTTIMDKCPVTNLHFWLFCARVRREYNLTCLTSRPSPHPVPYNVDNYCLQFLLIFSIVLGEEGGTVTRFFKKKAALFLKKTSRVVKHR